MLFRSPSSRGRQDGRLAVAFVLKEDGTVEPRPVRLGIGDWDQTAVLSGLEEGEQVAIIGAAQLQAQQQEFLNRMRDRAGGGPVGGGPRSDPRGCPAGGGPGRR